MDDTGTRLHGSPHWIIHVTNVTLFDIFKLDWRRLPHVWRKEQSVSADAGLHERIVQTNGSEMEPPGKQAARNGG